MKSVDWIIVHIPSILDKWMKSVDWIIVHIPSVLDNWMKSFHWITVHIPSVLDNWMKSLHWIIVLTSECLRSSNSLFVLGVLWSQENVLNLLLLGEMQDLGNLIDDFEAFFLPPSKTLLLTIL